MKAITYHEDYNKYDLGIDHPLVGDKPRKTMEKLEETHLLKELEVLIPAKAQEADLLKVHTQQYVDHIKYLSKVGGYLSVDTPAPIGIYEYARLATGGSILAGEKLFEGYTITINPLAGFHHASRDHSSGFCFFNDIAITIECLRQRYRLKRFLIIDLDVHHSNGTQEIYFDDPTVLNISFHQDGKTLYPGTGSMTEIGSDNGKGFSVNLPLPKGTTGKSYVKAFDTIIPPLVDQFDPEFIIYQSGVDTHHSDPLAGLQLTYQTYYHLARNIHHLSKTACHKLLVLFGGGYNNKASVNAYYNIVCGLLEQSTYLKEDDIPERYETEVDRRTKELIKILANYWKF